jgi:hypothetical protein
MIRLEIYYSKRNIGVDVYIDENYLDSDDDYYDTDTFGDWRSELSSDSPGEL